METRAAALGLPLVLTCIDRVRAGAQEAAVEQRLPHLPVVRAAEELREHGEKQLATAIAASRAKATEDEVADYKGFVLNVAQRVAAAHKEEGQSISAPEQARLDEIAASLDAPPADATDS